MEPNTSYRLDTGLFNISAHNPSLGSLKRSMKGGQGALKDFCIPVNPYFPTKAMFDSYRFRLEEALKFYPDQNIPIAEVLGKLLGLNPEHLVLVNGSTELITWIDHLFVSSSILTPVPTFGRWTDLPRETGKDLHLYYRKPENDFALEPEKFVDLAKRTQSKVAVICNPNNPTGAFLEKAKMLELINQLSHLDLVVVDESFIEFVDSKEGPSIEKEAHHYPNLIVVKSLGKNFGLHGVRFGYGVANKQIIQRLQKHLPFWNINGFAEMVIRDLQNHWADYQESRRKVIRDRKYLEQGLKALPSLHVFPAQSNFVYFKLDDRFDGTHFRNSLINQFGYFIRECGNKIGATSNYFRVAANPQEKTDGLLKALHTLLSSQ